MSVKYRNKSAGQKCDGVCDKCNNYSGLIIHNVSTFCQRCVDRLSGLEHNMNIKRKLLLPVDNLMKLDYCTMCNARPIKLIRVNYGICRDCLKKFGRKYQRSSNEQLDKTKGILNRYRRKIGLKTLTEEEANKRLSDMKKQKR